LETVASASLSKSSPVNQATGQITTPTLTWKASSGATRYEYCYDTVNNDACDDSWRDADTSLSAALSSLSDGVSYYWQVRAVYGAATTEANDGAWWAFQINMDATPPAVTSVTPGSNATGVNAASAVTATFSEAIDAATITPDTFVLRNSANVVVAAMVSYSVAHFATLTPTAALAGKTTYTATITGSSSGVKDLAGNPLATTVVWSFTTGDTTPPVVTSVTPANGASGLSALNVVTATFSEAIAAATLTTSTFVLRNPANVMVTATVSYNTSTRVGTLTPSAALAASTTYSARIAGGVSGVKDAAGNALASDVVWSFTTGTAASAGVTTIGSSLDSGDSHVLNGSRVRTSFAGQIASMSVYVGNVDSLSANRQYQVAIYTDSAGRPGALLARSAPGTLVGNAWNTLGVSALVQSNTNYWLLFNTNGRSNSVNNMRYTTGSTGQGVRSQGPVIFGAWPATAPPVTIGNLVYSLFATFGSVSVGSTTIGGSLDSGDSNAMNGSRVRTSAGGQIASMSVYVGNVDSVSANRQYQVAIYTDNAGRPGTLLARSATGKLAGNAWNTLSVSASLQPSTNYWLMFNTNGRSSTVNNLRYNNGSPGQGAFSAAPVTFGTWSAAAPAATIDNLVFSMFATFGS
jgi:hypothetical protein